MSGERVIHESRPPVVTPLPCVKCGSEDIWMRFEAHGHYGCPRYQMPWHPEHMDYGCRRCAFKWAGPTLEQDWPLGRPRRGR